MLTSLPVEVAASVVLFTASTVPVVMLDVLSVKAVLAARLFHAQPIALLVLSIELVVVADVMLDKAELPLQPTQDVTLSVPLTVVVPFR